MITVGLDYALRATEREADKPVSATIDDIDLRRTVFEQLKVLLPQERRANLTLNAGPIPKFEDGQPYSATLAKFAAQSAADATLFLAVSPQFSTSINSDPRIYAQAQLVAKSGQVLMMTLVQFAGPKAPDVERADVVRWWADGRYRRFLLQGVRATLTPVADGLGASAGYSVRLEALRDKLSRMTFGTSTSHTLRSPHCAVHGDEAPLVYRVELLRQYVLLAALCTTDEEAQLATDADREVITIVPVANAAAIVVPRNVERAEAATPP